MDRTDWWRHLDPVLTAPLLETWIPVGSPGFAGADKAPWRRLLDERFTPDGWRFGHVVRGAIVPVSVAIRDYEASYRRYLRDRPALVRFLATACGNVYDFDVANVHDEDYEQPHTDMNHYQDISVRRVMSELVDDPDWPDIRDTPVEVVPMPDLGTGMTHEVPRARGFRGRHLLQIRDPLSPGYLQPGGRAGPRPGLDHEPAGTHRLVSPEGCGHLSVEAFWQMSKVVEVRLDRFLELGDARVEVLAGL